MAKKKQKKQQGQQFLSPEQYIKQKARSLEIGACYVSDDIEEMGEGHLMKWNYMYWLKVPFFRLSSRLS